MPRGHHGTANSANHRLRGATLCAMGLLAVGGRVEAQNDSGRVTVVVRSEHRALAEADVRTLRGRVRTDRSGRATIELPVGPFLFTVARVGFRPETLRVIIRPSLDTVIPVDMVEQTEALTPVVVTATRVPHRVEDEPTRVEVLAGDEIDEKTQTQPGNLTRLLEEMSGVQVQSSSPPTGAANLRIQGLPGQYTEILTDGLPLWSPQLGGLGLAQVPPLDLKQAEVIKGAASALYGPAALGGVVNLVSRPPGADERDFVLNQTSQSGTDAVGWTSERVNDRLGFTLLGGVHRQSEQDLDGEGWADVPGYDRAELRPRVYWNSGHGASLMVTAGAMTEHRVGGTPPGTALADSQTFATASNTNRLDGGLVGVVPVHADTLTIRASGTQQWERDDFGPTSYFSVQHGHHATLFSEATFTIPQGRATWLLGTGFEQDRFTSPEVSGFDYSFSTPAIFAQLTLPVGKLLAFTASGRRDWQNQYGTFCNPRLSALWRAPGSWRVRLSGATGFFAPTPFIDETEGIPLARLVPFGTTSVVTCGPSICSGGSGTGAYSTTPFGLQAEQARYAALDITKHAGPVSVTGTVFASTVEHPLILIPQASLVDEQPQLVNASGPTETTGGEVFAEYADEPFVVLLEYAYVNSTSISPLTGDRIEAPLVPRNSGGLDVAWESDESDARVALDVFYTGTQNLLEDPYRTTSVPYATVDLLVSKGVGKTELYVSGQNLTNIRQTQWDPLLLPGPGDEFRWTTPVWAPLAGRVVNAGVRLGF